MSGTRTKKFYYRRAKWDGQGKQTLEGLLVAAHRKLPTSGDRTFLLANGNELQGAHSHHDGRGFLIHIAYYSPDQPTSTIAKNKRSSRATIAAEAAPPGKDYLQGDIFVLVKGNHVLLCPSAARETLAEQYIFLVLQTLNVTAVGSLCIDRVAKTSKLKMIREEGVKEIQLGASLYEASLMEIERDQSKVASLKAAVANQIQQIFAKDPDLKAIKESENLNINISIRFDGREGRKVHKDPHFGEAGKERLLKASQRIIRELEDDGDDDGFVIITGNNNTITSGEVREFESYKVETLGKSLSYADAWEKLIQFYDHLLQNGSLSK